tara:strand:- start:138 stop:1376 length:1239 start_codon:yes stop_codon:yes gene_type:complete
MTFLEQLQESAGLLSNDVASVGNYMPQASDFVSGVPQNRFVGNQFQMPGLSLAPGQQIPVFGGTMGSGVNFGNYTPGAFGSNYQSQTGIPVTSNVTPQAGGGGGEGGYYGFQGGDVPLSEFDPTAFTFPSVFGIVTGLLNDIFSGDATQDEIDTFNAMTSGDPTAGYSALSGLLTEGNVIDTTGLTPIGIQGTVMTSPSGDTFIGDPVTGQGVNQNPISNTVNPATATISTTPTGDTYYSGGGTNNPNNNNNNNNNGGNNGGNTGGNTGGGFTGGGFCFDPNTLVEMLDGTEKLIKDIKLGDETKGGEVTGVFQFKASDEIHNYKGVTVAGSHYVKEDGKFIMVQDSPISFKIDKIPTVHSLDTTGRRIWIQGIEFADYNGDGIAKEFLHNAGVDLTGFDKEVLRQVEDRLI